MFVNKINTRIRLLLVLLILFFIIIFIRVFYIQVFDYSKLNELANDLWNRELPIAADRGKILDRNGKEIATSITTSSLVVIPNQIKDKEYTAKKISEILNEDYNEIYKHITKKTSIERIHPEGRNLNNDIANKIEELHIDGVYLVKESKRYYPYKNLLSHTLGYVGIDNQGLSGLELYYDNYLTGKNGAIKYYSDGKGNKLQLNESYIAPTSGMNVSLTIDLDLQLAVEKELDNVISMYNPDDALILAMEPNTGEILAMASRPDFDSNNYKNYSIETINRNLPVWMTYEPGSTFKIMTLSAALNENKINLFEDNYYDSGSINVSGSKIKCWKAGGHGFETYLQVVENSCNPGFVVMGQKLGKEKLMDYIYNFGFGMKTGIDLNGESTGIMFDINKMGPVETATTSFGQGISVTPIQQVTAVSAAVNGGILYKPYILSSINEPETNSIIYKNNKTKVRSVIKKETSDLVKYTLESVVANGTGHNAYIENYRVGGKTGTAQKVKDGSYMSGNYIVSFIGFMPADDPKIVVYVAIDNPKGVVQYGGTVSAPVAKNILNSAIDILEINQDKEGMIKEYTWLDTKYVKLPDVLGKNKEEARKKLKGFNILYSGSGDTIVYETPKANTYVKEGSTVELMLK